MKKFLQRNWPQIFIVVVAFVLFLTNFESGKYLLGWDNTAPELNFSLNLNRNIFGIWQEYRGLGTLDGMAHASNIIHLLYTWVLSIFLPQNFIRWVFNIAMHTLGGLGMFLLIKNYFLPEIESKKKAGSEFIAQIISLCGAVFYQFNMMTLQMFYIPLEVFSIHFAAIPWGLLFLLKYLKLPTPKNLLWLALINLAFISQAHVPSVFISYVILNAVFLLSHLLRSPSKKWKEFISVVLVLFAVNSFWGLPNIYSTIQKAPEISQAKINLLSTDEIFLRNQAWGDLKSVATFGGFNLDYHDWDLESGKFVLMMGDWLKIYTDQIYQLTSIIIFSLSVFGFLLSIIKSKNRNSSLLLPSALAWLFFFSMLANNTPVIKVIPQFFRDYIPFFHDIFRFTLTKFSLIFVALTAIQFSVALEFLTKFFKNKQLVGVGKILLLAIIVFQLWNFRPAFNGQFFYSRLKVSVPTEYQDLKRYLSEKPSYSRVAFLPVSSPYGWTTYSWGYRGSGFIWQMIPQPTLDRAFDAWSKENEEFYIQFYQAQKGNDIDTISKLLRKYQISYVLLDENVVTPDSNSNEAYLEKIQNILTENLRAYKVWSNQRLSLYQLDGPVNKDILPVSAVDNPPIVSLDNDYNRLPINISKSYLNAANFSENLSPNFYFPFSNLSKEVFSDVTYSDEGVTLSANIPENFRSTNSELEIPGLPTGLPSAQIANVSFNNRVLNLSFNKPMVLSFGDQNFNFPELSDISLEIGDFGPDIYVSVNQQIFEVAEGNSIDVQLRNLLPNREIEVLVFDKQDAIQENDETILSENDAQRFRIESNYWDSASEPRYLQFVDKDISSISIFIPTISQENTLEALRDTKPINCDVFKRGNVEKEQTEEYFIYKASNKGAACESFGLFHADTNLSHLLRVEGENVSGRNLKIFLANKASDQLDLEYLMNDKVFDTTFPLLSWPYLENSFYTINHESRSFGDDISENHLASVKVYTLPISIDYLTNIRINNPSGSSFTNDGKFQVLNITKNNIAQYRAKFAIGANSKQVINLNQAYDKGWLAWNYQEQKFLSHYQLNNWSNAWLIENNSGNDTEIDLVIFYWPQLLVFAGYGLAISTILYLTAKSRQK